MISEETLAAHAARLAELRNVVSGDATAVSSVEQAEQLLKQHNRLLQFNDDALSASTRVEHAAITQRISNLQSGLETWLQFLNRISKLIKNYDDKIQKVQSFFDNVQDVITNHAQDPSSSHSSVIIRLENLRQIGNRVTALTIDLVQLDVIQEMLKECVTPMDLKTISQRMWLLWQQQGDLDYQLGVICQKLEEETLGLRSAFKARHTKFISWTYDLEKWLEEESENGTDITRGPEELLRKLGTELLAEMALKKGEYVWLTTTGTNLVNACGEDYNDVVAKQNIVERTNEVYGRWKHLQSLGKSKIYKKKDSMTQTITQLELRIAEIKPWLHQMEVRLAEPLVFERCNKETVDRLCPPQPQHMTSISAKDAYIVELTSAIEECCSNTKSKKNLVAREIPEQGLPELRSAMYDAYSFSCEHEAGKLLCPLCTKRNWAELDNDLRSLEQWLQAAEGVQGSQHSTPSNIEQLEDMIQDHKEFLLDLDNHRSVIRSLSIVTRHLADHSDDNEEVDKLSECLEKDNKRWENVCLRATAWQNILQRALMNNRQFHMKIEELCSWLEKIENQIRTYEPVDLTANIETVNAKFESFCAFMAKLKLFEPQVLSLQESANQLLKNDEAPDGSNAICTRLSELRLKLDSLMKLTRIYILKLGAVLDCDPNEIGLALASSPTSAGPTLHSFNYNLLDQVTAPPGPFAIQDNNTYTGTADDDNDASNTTVLRRSYGVLGRVIRASLPIQAIMLLLFGVASLVPSTEEDYACSLVTNLTNSFVPQLHYP